MAQLSRSLREGGRCISTTFLNAVVATDNGTWMYGGDLEKLTIDVSGITNATIQVRGSNALQPPANSSHGVQIGSDITSDMLVSVDMPVNWIKVMVSIYVAGTIYSRVIGHRVGR